MAREFSIERIGSQSSRNHTPTGRSQHASLYEELEDEADRIEQRRMTRQHATPRKMKKDHDSFGRY